MQLLCQNHPGIQPSITEGSRVQQSLPFPKLFSFPLEILVKILLNVESSDIISLLRISELKQLWPGLLNLIFLGRSDLKELVPPDVVASLSNISQFNHFLTLVIIGKNIILEQNMCEELINEMVKTNKISQNIFIIMTKDISLYYNPIRDCFSTDGFTICSFETHELKPSLNFLQTIDNFSAPYATEIYMESSKVKISDPNEGFRAPKLKVLNASCCTFENVGNLFILPCDTTLIYSKIKPLFQNHCNFNHVENLTFSRCEELRIFKDMTFPKLRTLAFENMNVSMLISNIHAPELQKFSLHLEISLIPDLERSVSIKDCVFDSLKEFFFSGDSITEMGNNFAPNLNVWNIWGLFFQHPIHESYASSMFSNITELQVRGTYIIPNNINLSKLRYLRCEGLEFFDLLNESEAFLPNLQILLVKGSYILDPLGRIDPFAGEIPIKIRAPRLEMLSMICVKNSINTVTKFPKLKRLRYKVSFDMQYIPSFHSEPKLWTFNKKKLPNLEVLDLEFEYHIASQSMIGPVASSYLTTLYVEIEQCNFPKLKSLSIRGGTHGHNNYCTLSSTEAPMLEVFSLKGMDLKEKFDFSRFKGIRAIKLSNGTFNDVIIKNNTQLEYLKLFEANFKSLKVEGINNLIQLFQRNTNAIMFMNISRFDRASRQLSWYHELSEEEIFYGSANQINFELTIRDYFG